MNIYFTLRAERVYYVVKNDKVELLIANNDRTCFRTLEQLIEMKGSVEVKAIKFGEMIEMLKQLKKDYDRKYIKLRYGKFKNNKFVAKKLKSEEIAIYESLEEERKEKAHEIIGDANDFFVKDGYYLRDDGVLKDKNNKTINQEYILEKKVRYFLTTGERVQRTSTNIEYYYSTEDLKNLRKSLQKQYDEKIHKNQKEIEENNEKYLNF